MAESGISPVEGGVVVTLAGAFGATLKWGVDAWLKARRSPEQKAADKAGLDAQSVKTAGDLMEGMREDLDALRDEMRAMKSAHAEEMKAGRAAHVECERTVTELRGEVRKLQANNTSLHRMMLKLKDPASTQIGGELEGGIFEVSRDGVEDVSGRPLIDKELTE